MKQNKTMYAVAISTFVLLGGLLTGCSEQTKDAASNTADSAGNTVAGAASDTANNTMAAGEAVGGAVTNTGEAAMETGGKMADATGKAVENTGEAVAGAGKMAGEAVGGVAEGVGNIAEAATLTPAIKGAIIATKIDGSTVNVDTKSAADTIVLMGTVKSESEKKMAAQIAAQEVKKIGKTYKIRNDLTIAP